MSTIGGLLLPQFQPYDLGRTLTQATNIQGGQLSNQTRLLELADLKAKQQAEALMLERIKQDPALAQQLFGASTLGSLGAPAGPPGGAPMMQQPFAPGQPPGAPQLVPGGQDLSQFATQGGPPQSVLGSLGPQPQGPMQAPQNPVLAMAQRDPRAALMLQQQLQGQQDRQWKMQEQQLSMGVKVMEYIARGAQAVKSQEALEALRQDIARVHPQAAASLPQMYSKEAMEPFIARGTAASERATNALAEAKARNLDMETRMFPELAKRFGMGDDAQAPAQEGAQPPVAPGGGGAGNMGQRNNNPYNIKLGRSTQHWVDEGLAEVGETAQDGGKFIKFKDPQLGERAGLELLQGAGYRELTVDAALKRWSNNGYGAEIAKDIPPDVKITDLSAAQMRSLMAAMREREGWNAKPSEGATAPAPAADPRIAGLEAKIAQRTRDAQIASLMKNESLSTRLNDDANRLKDERTRLLEENRRQQERAEETPRALERERQLTEQKQNLERQRQAGPLLPEDRRKHLAGLRENVLKEPTFKIYQDVRNGYQNVKVGAASDSAQGDLAIFNGLAKILDPTSSVMSGEAKNIEDAQGQLQIWFNSPAKFLEGDRISKENRPRFLKMAYELAKEKLTTAQTELKTVWGPLAHEVGIDFTQVVPLPDLTPLGPGPNVSKFDKILEKAK